MSQTRRLGSALVAAVLFLPAARMEAQKQPDAKPTNDLPNPYRTIEGWAKMPEGRTWGSTSAVDIDRDGVSIWVAERCGENNCAASNLDPILKFDSTGKLVKSFGAGLIISPHGIHVDRDGNIWVTDCACTGGGGGRGRRGGAADSAAGRAAGAPPPPPPAPAQPKGHQIFKFSPDGQLLLTLGKAGGARGSEFFWQPNDVLVAPNGDIYVAEGHSDADSAAARILKFSRDGRLLTTFGKMWSPRSDSTRLATNEELAQPHALAMDSQGRLFVGDRSNNRIQIFDQNFKHLATWYQFSRPSGIYIDRNDVIYVADSESGSVNRPHGAWKRGIRIGNARTGAITGFIPDPNETPTNTSAAEGVAVDARGNIYGAEVGPRALKRYVKN
jgi:sugar lactone lactonase YvrE